MFQGWSENRSKFKAASVPSDSINDNQDSIKKQSSFKTLISGFVSAVKIRISRRNKTSAIVDFDLDTKLEVLKHGPLLKTETHPKLQQWLNLDATCVHNIMRGTNTGIYVISGDMQNGKIVVHKAYTWHKKNRNLQTAVRRWKHYKCRA